MYDIHVCMCIYIYMIWMCIYVYVCVYVCIYIYIYVCVCVHVNVNMHICIYRYICMYIYMYWDMCNFLWWCSNSKRLRTHRECAAIFGDVAKHIADTVRCDPSEESRKNRGYPNIQESLLWLWQFCLVEDSRCKD